MRIDKRAHEVSILQTELEIVIHKFADEHDLSNIEILQALTSFQQGALKYMLRYERHGDYETPAMETPDWKPNPAMYAEALRMAEGDESRVMVLGPLHFRVEPKDDEDEED